MLSSVGQSPLVEPSQDWEEWERRIIESFRPVDTRALFWLGLLEIDLRGAEGHRIEDFPFDELRAHVDAWLGTLDADAPAERIEWSGGGVRLAIQARGRNPLQRGWRAMPSLNLLEQQAADLHLVGGGRRQLHTLTLAEVRRLAAGEMRVVGQGASYRETFETIAATLERDGLSTVSELHPIQIMVFAGALGLVEAPPELGNFEQGYRAIHGLPPDE